MEMKEEALKLADEFKNRECWTDVDAVLWCEEASDMIRRLVEELDKQGEPVAWLRKYGDGTWFADTKDHSKTEVCIPLYTAPQTKPLSDEEILDCLEKSDLPMILLSDFATEKMKVFARAILQKASEK